MMIQCTDKAVRKFTRFSLTLGAVFLSFYSSGSTAAEKVICPASYSGVQKSVDGFEVIVSGKPDDKVKGTLPFSGLMMFDGHPKELASLAPDNESDPSDRAATWSLNGDTYWVVCEYGKERRDVQLAKHLHPVKKSCNEIKASQKESLFRGVKCK